MAKTTTRFAVAAAALLLATLPGARGAEHAKPGDALENETLPALDGGTAPLLSRDAKANVFIFFRPKQEHSLLALKRAAAWQREFASKPVRFVGVVSSRRDPEEVRAALREAGVARMPVLVDEDDRLLARLGVHLHPVVGIADGAFRLVGFEPWRSVNFDARVRTRIRVALKEIDAAAAQRAEDPPEALMPNEVPGAVAQRNVNLGEKLLDRKQYEKAAEHARKALQTDPRSSRAHALLGRALAAQGRCGDATKAFEEALRLDPANAAAAEGMKRCGR
jgi:tetratricopeptide (TPR) repeat protein